MGIFTKEWWKATMIRVIRTSAQVFAAALPTSAIFIHDVSWGMIGSTVGLAAIACFATCLSGLPEATSGDAVSSSDGQ